MKKRVLLSSFYNREAVMPAVEKLSKYADVVDGNDKGRSLTEEEIIQALCGADGVIAAEEPYTARVFDSIPSLKIIARDGVGTDNIDIAEATKHGVAVINAPVLHETVADLVFGLMTAAARKIVTGDRGMRAGCWTDRDRYLGRDVFGRTLGLIGFGRIARAVAKRASGFDMKVLAFDIDADREAAKRLGVRMTGFDELISCADIVSVHVPLTENTHKMINGEIFDKMKEGSYLINTSRGEVVDEEALIRALESGKLAGAGLDVVCKEPPRENNPLFRFENVVFTPHVGSDTYDTFLRVFECAVEGMIDFFSHKRPLYILNPEVLKSYWNTDIRTEEKDG